jgi:hypothetical protein
LYNHIGIFAVAHEAVCKAIFLGKVTRRFPHAQFAFLEGRLACQLYADPRTGRSAIWKPGESRISTKRCYWVSKDYGGPEMVEGELAERMMY